MAGKKKVRVSKNRKKYWKKDCDVTDVEEYLEEKRFEERIGGPVSEKPNEELFVIQTSATEHEKVEPVKKPKSLRCFQNLGLYSKVPPPIKVGGEQYSKKIKTALSHKNERITKRALKSLSQEVKKQPNANVAKGLLFTGEIRNLWADEEEVDPEIKDLVTFRDEYTCKRTPKVPSHRYQKPSLLPAVEIPHAGASYNPAYQHHQELLEEALIVEEKKRKDELHLKRVLTDMFPSKADAPTEKSRLEEMSQGLFKEDEIEGEDDEEKSLFSHKNPPVSFENRLTLSRKRKRKELKEKERLRLVERKHIQRQSEIFRLPSIKKQLNKEAELTERRAQRNLQRRADKMFQPRTLSSTKYEAPDLEVKLTDELCENLRKLKAEGNLLEDRFKSLQRRNLIEPRLAMRRKRKYKLKKQVKRGHRD